MNYLPGYEGVTPKLNTAPFNVSTFSPQRMKVVLEGIGSALNIVEVVFNITNVTYHFGYASNRSDGTIEGWGYKEDYSFSPTKNNSVVFARPSNVSSSTYMGLTRTSADFYAKDYGGYCEVVVFARYRNGGKFERKLSVPLSADGDNFSDRWERDKVLEWNAQHARIIVGELTWIGSGNADDEDVDEDSPPDDGTVNADGGRNLPPHKTAGDSLTHLQEYRGLLLDGGGITGALIPSGHLRLSPAYKELLVETDIMGGIARMPNPAAIRSIINSAAAAYGNIDTGAGIRMYWVVDGDVNGMPHTAFNSQDQAENYGKRYKNGDDLEEFVHLTFAEQQTDAPGAITFVSGTGGSMIYVHFKWNQSVALGFNFEGGLVRVVLHELTHTLLETAGQNGFDGGEHLREPPAANTVYVMAQLTAANATSTLFDDATISQINLKSKQSVER